MNERFRFLGRVLQKGDSIIIFVSVYVCVWATFRKNVRTVFDVIFQIILTECKEQLANDGGIMLNHLHIVCFDFYERHEDVIKWKHCLRYWPFVQGIPRWPVNSPQKGQRRGTLIFSLICAWISGWINNREACDLRHHRAHYDVIVIEIRVCKQHRRCHPQNEL